MLKEDNQNLVTFNKNYQPYQQSQDLKSSKGLLNEQKTIKPTKSIIGTKNIIINPIIGYEGVSQNFP